MSTYRIIRSDFESGLPSYGAEARTLFYWAAEEICGLKAPALVPCLDKAVGEAEAERFSEVLERLKRNEPIQYIFGRAYFYGLELKVDSRVLIPRPETEELLVWAVEKLTDMLKGGRPECDLRILDLCTGSGALAIALSKEFPRAEVYACDISEDALAVAECNNRMCGTSVRFFSYDVLGGGSLPSLVPKKISLIVSNPPYIRPSEKVRMQKNVLDFEPDLALFVPEDDPLVFYRAIAGIASVNLQPGGILMEEINEAFPEENRAVLRESALENIAVREDMRGKSRLICASRTF